MEKKARSAIRASFAAMAALAAANSAFAADDNFRLSADTPDATHAWAVHDRHRPNPPKVAAEPGRPPSDAIVLLDETEESFKANWEHKNPNRKADWKFADGAMESVRGAGYVRTKQSFGDCQLHVEWAAPSKVEGVGQGRGNSGVFLMGTYEVQVLDSYETDPAKDPNPNPNYADGQAGAVYGQNPPLVNPARAPGEWQTYDIVFHQPVWEDGKLRWPGSVTVFFNGVLVQDAWEVERRTTHLVRCPIERHAARLPLEIQDHGNPVRFRNIWIREIPSRYANVTHGGPAADPAAVMALRRKTAAKLAAATDWSGATASSVLHALEVLSYSDEPQYRAKAVAACEAYRQRVAAATAKPLAGAPFAAELGRLKSSIEVLVRNKVLSSKDSFAQWVNTAARVAEWEKQGMLRMVKSSKDGAEQPCWFWAPEKAKSEPVPLVVTFHTWGGDYKQVSHFGGVLDHARKVGWAMVGPNARGPNWTPPACGSDLVVSDVLDAVEYAKSHAKIDTSRIYMIGGSGGGHLTLLMAGRAPEVFAGAVAFCPITDLAQWWRERGAPGAHAAAYAQNIVASCGGTPAEKPEEYANRSPMTWLKRARDAGVPVYICTVLVSEYNYTACR